jgi:hypothetical protein
MIADGAINAIDHRREPPPRQAELLCPDLGPGVQRIQYLARGKKLAPSCEAFSAPGARAVRGLRPEKPITGTEMKNSPYLDKPFVPLSVALRSMLAETEAKIAAAAPAEKARRQQRAEVLREWITPKSRNLLST